MKRSANSIGVKVSVPQESTVYMSRPRGRVLFGRPIMPSGTSGLVGRRQAIRSAHLWGTTDVRLCVEGRAHQAPHRTEARSRRRTRNAGSAERGSGRLSGSSREFGGGCCSIDSDGFGSNNLFSKQVTRALPPWTRVRAVQDTKKIPRWSMPCHPPNLRAPSELLGRTGESEALEGPESAHGDAAESYVHA